MVSKSIAELPGPGNYTDESRGFGKDGKKMTFGGKQGQKYSDNPGPGAYDGNHNVSKAHNGNVKFGNSKRQQIVTKES